ncbi:ABC transporter ATP-binding protein [Sporomusa acidovorans]|uniref:Aliphatic sulfonates import ATP-binding protein SsuB n=1 Tax=Sporomusa acidovorans (strain ATCC 49682 / DSM 3132 / Mol) TaxID=1123286 RepID=A0ABZ3J3U3_SPOA4|nr:ABC transporter ATP-binding protein [Sporomusa acidovorans]OZC23084.1 bicarbonate transport ATP-binding protein CmpC [Sporomusa acidovorans DSM 3132]SDF04970.1 NitT/TauT family transport system ATP-binding protein [Sporomusa acidovorans]
MPYDNTSIVLKNVEKKFITNRGQITALANINISIGDGEFFSIVGPSGCGKTTLLRILAGLDTASGGSVDIQITSDGRPVNSLVFQEQSVFPWMTVIDNVAYGLKLRGISKKERYQIAEKYIRMIGLSKFAKAYPHQLSGGMKQRVSVARAFANDPEILLMDEPFGALDEQNRILLQQELLRIWELSKKTTVFITHSIDEALCLSDRILIMTAHPGTVKSIIDIDLPRPRDIASIRTTMHYNELFRTIWLTLREEVLKGKKMELAEN